MDRSSSHVSSRPTSPPGSAEQEQSRLPFIPPSPSARRPRSHRLTLGRKTAKSARSSRLIKSRSSELGDGDDLIPGEESTREFIFNPASDIHSGYVLRAGDSLIPTVPSYESVARRRHLMASTTALNLPPVVTTICCLQLALYLYRENLHVREEKDICVSWKHVWTEGQFWRLFVAQFFHFNKVSLLINSVTLFTIGRYLERKVTVFAMFTVILVMSVASQFIYILINPLFCKSHQSEFTHGFGNVIYSLRVLLAYALEPRNYERDLVFGLYPMVVSASHAPWQPLLDLLVFKLVLPEQCITGHVSGIVAGFLVTGALLLWPTKGVYIANPPYYWTLMGTTDPNDRTGGSDGHDGDDEDRWRIKTYTNSDFWLPASSAVMSAPPKTRLARPHNGHGGSHRRVTEGEGGFTLTAPQHQQQHWENSMKRRSDELKGKVVGFLTHSTNSILGLITRNSDVNTSGVRNPNNNTRRNPNANKKIVTQFLYKQNTELTPENCLQQSKPESVFAGWSIDEPSDAIESNRLASISENNTDDFDEQNNRN